MHSIWWPASSLLGKAILDHICTRLCWRRAPDQQCTPAACVEVGSHGASGTERAAQPILCLVNCRGHTSSWTPICSDLLETSKADVSAVHEQAMSGVTRAVTQKSEQAFSSWVWQRHLGTCQGLFRRFLGSLCGWKDGCRKPYISHGVFCQAHGTSYGVFRENSMGTSVGMSLCSFQRCFSWLKAVKNLYQHHGCPHKSG